ncbi:hypothetical protein WME73_01835 [Sorangium sp. So ce302]
MDVNARRGRPVAALAGQGAVLAAVAGGAPGVMRVTGRLRFVVSKVAQ